jgi:hypothetical protein
LGENLNVVTRKVQLAGNGFAQDFILAFSVRFLVRVQLKPLEKRGNKLLPLVFLLASNKRFDKSF